MLSHIGHPVHDGNIFANAVGLDSTLGMVEGKREREDLL